MINNTADYFVNFTEVLKKTSAIWRSPGFDVEADLMGLNQAVESVVDHLLENSRNGKKIMAIGNGGSAAIAIHTLNDYAQAGGLKTIDLYGSCLPTYIANDDDYENVFYKSIELFAESGDILFAISSSGKSPNMLKTCGIAAGKNCHVITFSGFGADNPLRRAGRINFYVPSTHYGFVELSHQALLYCILNLFVMKRSRL